MLTVHFTNGEKRQIDMDSGHISGGRFAALDKDGRLLINVPLQELFGLYWESEHERETGR